MFYLHCLLPIIVWWSVVLHIRASSFSFRDYSIRNVVYFLTWSVVYMAGSEVLVMSFFERRLLSLPLLLISVWPHVTERWRTNNITKNMWLMTCLALSIFPLLPVIGSYSNAYIM